MKPEAKNWMSKAESDLITSKYNLKGKRYDAAIFYAQQAAEKSLKSLLIERTGEFPKIHDLIKLAKLISLPLDLLELCSKINPAYIVSRYPDQAGKYSVLECEELVEAAERV